MLDSQLLFLEFLVVSLSLLGLLIDGLLFVRTLGDSGFWLELPASLDVTLVLAVHLDTLFYETVELVDVVHVGGSLLSLLLGVGTFGMHHLLGLGLYLLGLLDGLVLFLLQVLHSVLQHLQLLVQLFPPTLDR